MTPQHIQIVQENFKRIAPLADEVANVFYNRLFALDASLRPMFDDDLSEQKHRLIMMLKFSVETLDRIDVFEPSLEALGRRHSSFGVRDEHYKTVGAALILTLRARCSAQILQRKSKLRGGQRINSSPARCVAPPKILRQKPPLNLVRKIEETQKQIIKKEELYVFQTSKNKKFFCVGYRFLDTVRQFGKHS